MIRLAILTFLLTYSNLVISKEKVDVKELKFQYGESTGEIGEMYISYTYPLIIHYDSLISNSINNVIKENVLVGQQTYKNGNYYDIDIGNSPKEILETLFRNKKQMDYLQGLSNIDYTILYNDKSILSIKISCLSIGANFSIYDFYFSFDLTNGSLISLDDVVKINAKYFLLDKFKKLIVSRLNSTIAKTKQIDLSEFYVVESVLKGEFDIDESRITFSDYGIHLFFEYDFPHIVLSYEPESEFFISYEDVITLISEDSIVKRFKN